MTLKIASSLETHIKSDRGAYLPFSRSLRSRLRKVTRAQGAAIEKIGIVLALDY